MCWTTFRTVNSNGMVLGPLVSVTAREEAQKWKIHKAKLRISGYSIKDGNGGHFQSSAMTGPSMSKSKVGLSDRCRSNLLWSCQVPIRGSIWIYRSCKWLAHARLIGSVQVVGLAIFLLMLWWNSNFHTALQSAMWTTLTADVFNLT